MDEEIWAKPRDINNLDDCFFYHTMDIPKYGTVYGGYDLRGGETAYLGNVDFKGKRVLEVGTASGHLCFTMEKIGAEVVGYDLSDKHEWDIVPYYGSDYKVQLAANKKHIDKINNGYWLAHKAYNSNAKVVYGSVYDIPDTIGKFDIGTFGCILLHLRDPFLALQRTLAHVEDTAIVTDVYRGKVLSRIEHVMHIRLIRFQPNAKRPDPFSDWWVLSPGLVSEFLQILGFKHTRITYHHQKARDKNGKYGKIRLFTVTGHRK